MNVFITGGAGYIGTELAGLLLANPQVEKVVVYDNLSRLNYNLFLGQRLPGSERLSFIKGELLDSRALRKALKGMDIVYHLAAKATTPFANTDAHVYEQVNHWGTAELVYALEESDVKRLIYTSSTGVYGAANEPATEATAADPQTLYAISKLRGEEHVRRLGSRLDTYIMRCGNTYGYSRSMRFDAVINKFAFETNFNKRISIQGDGKQWRSFIHIDALTQGLANLLNATLPAGTYNLTQQNLRVIEILDALKELVPDLEFLFINQHLRLQELRVQANEAVNKALGIPAAAPLKDDLAAFLQKFSF